MTDMKKLKITVECEDDSLRTAFVAALADMFEIKDITISAGGEETVIDSQEKYLTLNAIDPEKLDEAMAVLDDEPILVIVDKTNK